MAGFGEDKVVDKLNRFFIKKRITAFAYRQKQYKYAKQWTDITVDSKINKYFLAIEVKAKRGKNALNYMSDFTVDENTGEHQLSRQVKFASRTGRKAFVVLYCRMGAGRKLLIYVFDSIELQKRMRRGDKSLLAKDFDKLNKKNELWELINNVKQM